MFTVQVGFTDTRPIVVDERTAFVIIEARNKNEACLLAAQMVGCTCEVVTSTTLIGE